MLDHESSALSVPTDELIQLIESVIKSGSSFKLLVTGNSMFPFIKHMRDSVILTHPSNRKIKHGEIVFIVRETQQLVLHRVVKIKSDGFIMNGDAQNWDEFVTFEKVIAVVSTIQRKGRLISCDNFLYRLLSELWMLMRPFRSLLFRSGGILRRAYRKVWNIVKNPHVAP